MPLKKVSKNEYKRRFKPWVSNEILIKMKEKDKIFRKYLRCKDRSKKSDIYMLLINQ